MNQQVKAEGEDRLVKKGLPERSYQITAQHVQDLSSNPRTNPLKRTKEEVRKKH